MKFKVFILIVFINILGISNSIPTELRDSASDPKKSENVQLKNEGEEMPSLILQEILNQFERPKPHTAPSPSSQTRPNASPSAPAPSHPKPHLSLSPSAPAPNHPKPHMTLSPSAPAPSSIHATHSHFIPANITSKYYPNFYVVTAIFNPASYESRYSLYDEFAKHMEETGAHLITIECIFPSLGQTEFKVTTSTNPNHIQVKSDSVYWIKEDLLNLAVDKLPSNAKWVAWLDADIEFHDKDWIQQTISALDRHVVVQMFKYAHFLNAQDEIIRTDYSFGYSLVNGKPLLGFGENDWYPHPGYGWAMSVESFKKSGGLPSYDIVGGGDLYFAYTLVNHMNDVIEKDFDEDYKRQMMDVSVKTYQIFDQLAADDKMTVAGFVPVTLSHKWHGARKDRGYVDRLYILIAHDFNYFEDMTRGSDGLHHYKNGTNSLQQDVKCYFENRNEDTKKEDRTQCYSGHHTLYLSSIPKSLNHNQHTCGKEDSLSHEPGHYYGKTYTYYTTQNYQNVLDTKALEAIVKLIKSNAD